MLVFDERGKPEYPGKNLSWQSRGPTNSIHIWHRVRKSNPGHIGGRQVLSPLGQPCHLQVKNYNSVTKNFPRRNIITLNFIMTVVSRHSIVEFEKDMLNPTAQMSTKVYQTSKEPLACLLAG